MFDRLHRAAPRALLVTLFLVLALPVPGRLTAAEPPTPPARPTAPTGSLSGTVTSLEGIPVADATVEVVELRRRAAVAPDGSFSFSALPPGDYLLEAVSPRLGAAVQRVKVAAGGTSDITLVLDLAVHREEVVVTAGPDVRSRSEVAQATTVLTGEELDARLALTLGETLAGQPGVASTSFGAGASRPVIRGLGGDRIRVLENGVGTGDASTTSPDHAVSFDPLAAERIEVLRGPATLLYGSSAVGGVVNVLDGRIPDTLPDGPLSGTVELRGGTGADERGGGAALTGAVGRLAWQASLLKREADDYEIPGFAESKALRAEEAAEGGVEVEGEEEAFGVLPNSASESEGGSLGLSWIAADGFLGVSTNRFDSLYGIPGGHGHEEGEGGEGEEEAEEGGVRIDLRQRRYDLRGGLSRPFGIFRNATLRVGRTEYEHRELEGAEIGTVFLNDSLEGRLELVQRQVGPLTGSLGVQVLHRDFEAIGDEAFVPPTTTDSWALFAFQQVARGPWTFQLGGRYESQDVEARTAGVDSRSLSAASGSVGVVWLPGEAYGIGLSLARSVKLPNAEELFSNGPHLATDAFEIGDPGLDEETSLGADLTLRKRTGRLTGELNLFVNRFDDYIFEQATGEEEDGLDVFRYVQRDAEFRGAELSGILQLYHGEPHHLDLELGADLVRAELRDTGEPLPRIPPRRYRMGLHYRGERFSGRLEGQRAEAQDRVSAFERPTDGYTLLNATLGYRFFLGNVVYDLLLRGSNLTDEEARNHVSFLKDRLPLPGRDVSLALKLAF
jgi:iron complex outermembrane receptor protein